jgi:1,2-dihydroxy-3-keto-5-methylthiopentene dioxygenase
MEGDQRLPHNSGESVDFETLDKLGCLAYPSIGLDKVEEM